jgi:hypothetical protein
MGRIILQRDLRPEQQGVGEGGRAPSDPGVELGPVEVDRLL